MVTGLPTRILAISFSKMALEGSYLELTSTEENCYDAFVNGPGLRPKKRR